MCNLRSSCWLLLSVDRTISKRFNSTKQIWNGESRQNESWSWPREYMYETLPISHVGLTSMEGPDWALDFILQSFENFHFVGNNHDYIIQAFVSALGFFPTLITSSMFQRLNKLFVAILDHFCLWLWFLYKTYNMLNNYM